MESFARILIKRSALVSFLGVVLGIVGIYYSVQLYKNLRTNFEELLPTTARSVVDLDEVSNRLESIDNLAILVFSQDTIASRHFVEDLAKKLNTYPKTTISSVEYRINKELQFFRDRAALYMDENDLLKIKKYIKDRIGYERSLYNPLNIFNEEELSEPRLDFAAMQGKYSSRTSSYDRFPDGFYATPDETKRIVLAYMPGKTSSLDQVHRLKAAVVEAVASLNPKSYSPDLEVKYTGGVQDTIEENSALVADLELSTVVVSVLVTLAMILFFRSFFATMALVISLFIGTFWTFGASYYLVGYLNANSAFLGSIVLGNGINFGIIYLARYLEERRKGENNASAVTTAMKTTATSTATAALAAGLSYGSLALTGFRGFRQFGIIGLTGMVLCWISAYTLMPAFLTLFDRIHPLVKPGTKPAKMVVSSAIAWVIDRAPKQIWIGTLLLTLLAGTTWRNFSSNVLETDLSKLRNKESLEHGSAYLSKYQDEIFQRYLAPIVILPKSRDDAVEIADVLKAKKAQEGDQSLISSVQSIDDFIPHDQQAKIQTLRDIRALLPVRLLNQLSPNEQKRVKELLNPANFKPIGITDLPPLVVSKFTEKDGSIGKLVLVEPPLSHAATWEGDSLGHMIGEIREAADSIAPGTAVAGTLPITTDMFQAVKSDGPKATLFALVAVVLLVVLLFRDLHIIFLALLSLFLGVTWLSGFILGFGYKINFLNFIALPITFGIGIDYGVNIFQRYREEKHKDIVEIIKQTGSAVVLCSFTTIVGYCSLLIAGNQAFVSFGRLAVVGELACVTAAVVALPSYLLFTQRKAKLDAVKNHTESENTVTT
jgi:predicted RND superfamily exporter protein